MKTRKVIGGGIKLYQLITKRLVFTLSKNTSLMNGMIHNWKLEIKLRKETNL